MKKFKRLFILLALSILTIFALLRLGNIDISAETLARVDWMWPGLALVVLYVTVLIRGLRWQRILKTIGWPVSFVYALTLLMAGLFISLWTLIPISGVVTYIFGFSRALNLNRGAIEGEITRITAATASTPTPAEG